MDFESYYQLSFYEQIQRDAAITLGLSVCMVTASVFVLTVNVQVTLLVIFSVLLSDLFMMAVVHYWGLTFNFLIAV